MAQHGIAADAASVELPVEPNSPTVADIAAQMAIMKNEFMEQLAEMQAELQIAKAQIKNCALEVLASYLTKTTWSTPHQEPPQQMTQLPPLQQSRRHSF